MKKLLFLTLTIFFCAAGFPQNEKKITSTGEPVFHELFQPAPHTAPVACFRIPSLVTAPNGDLVVAIDERVPSCNDLRSNRDINIVIRRSTDNGESWTAPERIVDYPAGKSASDPSMIVDKYSGEIFLFFNFMDLDHEKEIYYLRFMKSADNGKTWSAPVDITSQITLPQWHHDFMFISSGRGFQTRSGTLLHTLVNLQRGLFVFKSSDHGKNWQLLNTPIKPADESKIVELEDGSWMINSRVNGLGLRYSHISMDEGKTWVSQPDSLLPDPGCNAGFIRYTSTKGGDKKNRLLFINPADSKERKNLTLGISYNEGKTWVERKTIFSGSAAYSSITILKNGEIGLVFEQDDYRKIIFARLSLHWLTDEKDNYKKTIHGDGIK